MPQTPFSRGLRETDAPRALGSERFRRHGVALAPVPVLAVAAVAAVATPTLVVAQVHAGSGFPWSSVLWALLVPAIVVTAGFVVDSRGWLAAEPASGGDNVAERRPKPDVVSAESPEPHIEATRHESLHALAATLARARSWHDAVSVVMVLRPGSGAGDAGASVGEDVTDALLTVVDAQTRGKDDLVWHDDDRSSWVALPGILPRRARAIAADVLRSHAGSADVPIGISGFPRDAQTAEALVERCHVAFDLAVKIGGARAVLAAEVPAADEDARRRMRAVPEWQ